MIFDCNKYDTCISREMHRTVYLEIFLTYTQIWNGKFRQIDFMISDWKWILLQIKKRKRRYFQWGKKILAMLWSHVLGEFCEVWMENKMPQIWRWNEKREEEVTSSNNQITISDIIRNGFGISQKNIQTWVKKADAKLQKSWIPHMNTQCSIVANSMLHWYNCKLYQKSEKSHNHIE